jgi:hypothetical protein
MPIFNLVQNSDTINSLAPTTSTSFSLSALNSVDVLLALLVIGVAAFACAVFFTKEPVRKRQVKLCLLFFLFFAGGTLTGVAIAEADVEPFCLKEGVFDKWSGGKSASIDRAQLGQIIEEVSQPQKNCGSLTKDEADAQKCLTVLDEQTPVEEVPKSEKSSFEDNMSMSDRLNSWYENIVDSNRGKIPGVIKER